MDLIVGAGRVSMSGGVLQLFQSRIEVEGGAEPFACSETSALEKRESFP